MTKKIILAVVALVFALHVFAVAPLVGVVAVSAMDAVGGVVVSDLLVSGVTALIGGTIMSMLFTANDANAPEADIRVPLVSNPAAIAASMPPTPQPGTISPTQVYTYTIIAGHEFSGASAGDACSKIAFSETGDYYGNGYATIDTYSYVSFSTSAGCKYRRVLKYVSTGNVVLDQLQLASPTVAYTCPGGYTLSSNSCALVNARAVPDMKYDVARNSSGFVLPPSSDEGDSPPSNLVVNNGRLYVSGKNSRGQPVVAEYSVSADGQKTYLTHYTQSEDGAQTLLTSQTIAVNQAGVVESATAATTTGSIALPVSGAVPVVNVGSVPVVNTGTSSGSVPIVFPSDYARVGESAAAADVVKGGLDVLHDDLTTVGANPADPVTPTDAEFRNAFFPNTFDDLLAWRMPQHQSVCPVVNLDYNLFGTRQQHLMDAQCVIAEQVRPTLSVVMVVVWIIVALFVLLGA